MSSSQWEFLQGSKNDVPWFLDVQKDISEGCLQNMLYTVCNCANDQICAKMNQCNNNFIIQNNILLNWKKRAPPILLF